MVDVIRQFGGKERLFRLTVGAVLDIEEACGGEGIGAIFKRIGAYNFTVKDLIACTTHPLIAGGIAPEEAKKLVVDRIEYAASDVHTLALDLLVSFFDGIEADGDGGDPSVPHDRGQILHGFIQAGVSPESILNLSYAAFVDILKAVGGKEVKPPTEEEFNEMLKAYEEQYGD